MNLADRLTSSRLLLAPLFFAVFFWGEPLGLGSGVAAVLLFVLFGLIEVSDFLDGKAARSAGTVSAFGKLFDPFADVIARVTYFVCFAFSGIMPLWALLVILYREFGILFLRMLLAERGLAMGARPGGKLKAVVYMVAGIASLVLWSIPRLGLFAEAAAWLSPAVYGLYVLAAVLSLASFADYVIQFRKLVRA